MEIQVKEIRLGNLVYQGTKIPVAVTEEMIYNAAKGAIKLDPIELTPDWLEKAGFILMDDNGDFKGNDRYWIHPKLYGQISLPNYFYRGIFIKYIHQLQNLYFALTGSELTFKQ